MWKNDLFLDLMEEYPCWHPKESFQCTGSVAGWERQWVIFHQNLSPPSTGRPLRRPACYQKTHCSATHPATWPWLTNCLFIDGSITTTTTTFIHPEIRSHRFKVWATDIKCILFTAAKRTVLNLWYEKTTVESTF